MVRPRVVVVGAGFAGLWAVKALRRAPVEVVLLDRNNYHSFFPLLYQVAAAELEPGDIAHPIRTIIRKQRNATFRLGEVVGVNLQERMVHTAEHQIYYDYLVVGVGSTTRFPDVPGAAEHSFPLRTLDEAVRLRDHILLRFEAAHTMADTEERRANLRFVVVGGGPTGVEFAGALQELINGPIRRDHRGIDPAEVSVIVLEAGPNLIPIFPPNLAAYAGRRLEKRGVDVRIETAVASVDTGGVTLGDGGRIDAATVVWTAGVGGDPRLAGWPLPLGKAGRVPVTATLQLEDHPEVYVTGDLALPESAAPMVAQNALQQGTRAARNIALTVQGRDPEPYSYRDLGNMAVIGRNAAVVHLHSKWGFRGYPAWILWLAVHLFKLIGFRNRLAALISWTGDYLFQDRVARIVLHNDSSPPDP